MGGTPSSRKLIDLLEFVLREAFFAKKGFPYAKPFLFPFSGGQAGEKFNFVMDYGTIFFVSRLLGGRVCGRQQKKQEKTH